MESLIIFDCDGVLVDSERLATVVEARILTELGFPHTPQDMVDRYLGRSATEVDGMLRSLMGPHLADRFDVESTAEVHAAFDQGLAVVPGIPELLERLDAAGVRTCVASSGSHKKMERTLGLTGLHARFRGRIYSATDVPRGKPAPDVFLHAAASEGVDPTDTVVIEDSVNGVLAARAAGMRVLGFGGGLSAGPLLQDAGAELFGTMDQLWTRLPSAPSPAAPPSRDASTRAAPSS